MPVLILSLTGAVVVMILSAHAAHVTRVPGLAERMRELAVRMAWCAGGFLGAILIVAISGAVT